MSCAFVKNKGFQVRTNHVTNQQQAEAELRLGGRVGKYYFNRRKGMGHKVALEEAVKP